MLFSKGVIRFFLPMLAILVLGGCSTGLDFFKSKKNEKIVNFPAKTLFSRGVAFLKKNDYDGAVAEFASLERLHPDSDFSRRGLLLLIYANYQKNAYEEVVAEGRRYVAYFPTSPDAAYAQYLIGMSYFHQIPDVTRDQKITEKTIIAFSEMLRRWPSSEYVADAAKRILMAQDQLAGREMYVGRFYLVRHNYIGAINRFREVLIRYQNTRHVEESLMRLTEAYLSLGVISEAQTAAAVLGKNFPKSPWYTRAYRLLNKKRAVAKERSESWISKLFSSGSKRKPRPRKFVKEQRKKTKAPAEILKKAMPSS